MLSLEHLSRLIFRTSSSFLDYSLKKLSLSTKFNNFLKAKERRKLRSIDNLKGVLIIPGINIGDAVIGQSFIYPLKNAIPDIEISYIYQRRAYPLMRANPNIDRHFPLFRSIGYPSKRDSKSLKNVIKKYNFDLIFNFCPYFSSKDFRSVRASIIYPTRLISNVIRNYASNGSKAQLVFQMHKFAKELMGSFAPYIKTQDKKGQDFYHNCIYMSQSLHTKAHEIMRRLKIKPHSKKILFNPDTSCSYTCIPLQFQLELLKGILANDELNILLNCGFTFEGIEKKLLQEIPSSFRKRITVIPKNTPIDVYAALIDNSHLFLSGDTAPLHIAAAKKVIVDSDNSFRNSTAVVSVFGATSSKIYGYDSFSDEHLRAAQSAPSRVFEAFPECKNLTCIDKIFKACPEVKCFDGLEPEPIVDYVQSYLS